MLLKTEEAKYSKDWSRDGRYIVYESQGGEGLNHDLWLLPVFGDGKPVPAVRTPADESDGRFSPDGEWLVYTSNESGRYEVYLERILPAPAQRLPVSTNGGTQPRWRADGRELFYVSPTRDLMSVSVTFGTSTRLGVPQRLFTLPISPPANGPFTTKYAAARDGQRFIVHRAIEQPAAGALTPINVIVNWAATLKR